MTTSNIKQIPLNKVIPNPEQPRAHFDEDALASLAHSLQVNGLIQPIVVEQAEDCYIIHDGERRWRAAQLAGLETIEAVVRPPLNGTAPRDRLVRALVANVQRENLNPIEEARAIAKMRSMGMTYSQIAGWTGWSEVTVTNRLQLLELDSELQELVATGKLPRDARVASALLTIADAEARVKLGTRLARPGITIPAIVGACQRLSERLAQENKLRDTRIPALALMGKEPNPATTERWENVRAAAQGMCDECSVNPHLPDAPEPAWQIIMEAATTTCTACSLRHAAMMGNLAVCRECPAVELLKRMVAHV